MKNLEALKTLFQVTESDTDALHDTWNNLLECVSRLEYITSGSGASDALVMGETQSERDALLQFMVELREKNIEQIFQNTVTLPSDVIVEFFTALCSISSEELNQIPPRVFSLQKLVEISYYNMSRIRMVSFKTQCFYGTNNLKNFYDIKVCFLTLGELYIYFCASA